MHSLPTLNSRTKLPVRLALAAFLVVAASAVSLSHAAASPAVQADATDGVNGTVYTTLQVGDRTYVGGIFTEAGGLPRSNVAVIRADGTVDPVFDAPANDTVYALAASADGSTIFVGGRFTTVGGTSRSKLAAVDADTGAVRSGWRAQVVGTVRALVTSSDRLYVGGVFSKVAGVPARNLTALSASTGAVDSAFAATANPDGLVRALTVSPGGQRLYATGAFHTVAGAPRPGIAELVSGSGAVTGFAPSTGGSGIAIELLPDGSRLFFSTHSNLTFAYDPATSNQPAYRVKTGGDVQAIAASATEVYIGGHFNGLPELKVRRVHLASFLPADGTLTRWNPSTDSFLGVWSLTPTPDALMVGGEFTTVNDIPQPGFARFSGTP